MRIIHLECDWRWKWLEHTLLHVAPCGGSPIVDLVSCRTDWGQLELRSETILRNAWKYWGTRDVWQIQMYGCAQLLAVTDLSTVSRYWSTRTICSQSGENPKAQLTGVDRYFPLKPGSLATPDLYLGGRGCQGYTPEWSSSMGTITKPICARGSKTSEARNTLWWRMENGPFLQRHRLLWQADTDLSLTSPLNWILLMVTTISH